MPLENITVMTDAQFNTYLTQQTTHQTAVLAQLTTIAGLLQAKEDRREADRRDMMYAAALTGFLAGRTRGTIPEDYFASEVAKAVNSLLGPA